MKVCRRLFTIVPNRFFIKAASKLHKKNKNPFFFTKIFLKE